MSRENIGISIAQGGKPLKFAAEYQKVLDSRWRFLEIEADIDVSILVPAVAAVSGGTGINYRKIIAYKHGLGFIPAYESGIVSVNPTIGQYDGDPYWNISIDENYLYIATHHQNNTAARATTMQGPVRIYNVPVMQEYEAIKDYIGGTGGRSDEIGMKALDGSRQARSPSDNSSVGFSIDTTKKILAIQKHGVYYVNPPVVEKDMRVTSINIATDIFTVDLSYYGVGSLDYMQIVGNPVSYNPSDYSTFPAPLVYGLPYYIIPITNTTYKFATTQANALAGIAIDITTTGAAMPGRIGRATDPLDPRHDKIEHGMGYPPTFLLSAVTQEFNGSLTLGPIGSSGPSTGIILADSRYLTFKGIQSQPQGRVAYIILKDPAELAS